MTGMPVSAICSTRYSARSMTPASTTTTTASGGPSCRPSTASTATCSSGELAVKLYVPGRSTISTGAPSGRVTWREARVTVTPG